MCIFNYNIFYKHVIKNVLLSVSQNYETDTKSKCFSLKETHEIFRTAKHVKLSKQQIIFPEHGLACP